MKRIRFACIALLCAGSVTAQQPYAIRTTYHIRSTGGWDYIANNKGKLYVAHATQVNILNEATGDSIGVINGTLGVHGIAFDNSLDRGYTTNGRLNNVSVFDLANNKVLAQVPAGENPDAIFFEPFTQTIVTCNGRSKDLSFIDPKKNTVVHTVAVDGKPEEAVSDGEGKLFVNLEDKNEIAAVDLKTYKVVARWPLNAEGPTGLAIDKATRRLFSGCENFLVVLDAVSGQIVLRLPIGAGCDGVVFNPQKRLIYTSNGQAGTLTVIEEKTAGQFRVVGHFPTQRSAHTLCFDPETSTIFLSAADFEKDGATARPRMIPGSFRVLVVK